MNQRWPSKLVAYVLMPDHFHLISNPRDGCIVEFCRDLKSQAAKDIIRCSNRVRFIKTSEGHHVWQESFKAMPLWSDWMIAQKIAYEHANPVRAGLVKTSRDYYWSSFRSFHGLGDEPLGVDRDWWWPEDFRKGSKAMKELGS